MSSSLLDPPIGSVEIENIVQPSRARVKGEEGALPLLTFGQFTQGYFYQEEAAILGAF
ncbi:MAG: hypothetical protein ABJN21_07975 [Paracoccaceae bacterium]